MSEIKINKRLTLNKQTVSSLNIGKNMHSGYIPGDILKPGTQFSGCTQTGQSSLCTAVIEGCQVLVTNASCYGGCC